MTTMRTWFAACQLLLGLADNCWAQFDASAVERMTRQALTSQIGTFSSVARAVFSGGALTDVRSSTAPWLGISSTGKEASSKWMAHSA